MAAILAPARPLGKTGVMVPLIGYGTAPRRDRALVIAVRLPRTLFPASSPVSEPNPPTISRLTWPRSRKARTKRW